MNGGNKGKKRIRWGCSKLKSSRWTCLRTIQRPWMMHFSIISTHFIITANEVQPFTMYTFPKPSFVSPGSLNIKLSYDRVAKRNVTEKRCQILPLHNQDPKGPRVRHTVLYIPNLLTTVSFSIKCHSLAQRLSKNCVLEVCEKPFDMAQIGTESAICRRWKQRGRFR